MARHHWKKEVAERSAEIPFTELVLARLAGLSLIERRGDALRAKPALGRFALRSSAELAAAEEEQPDLPFTP